MCIYIYIYVNISAHTHTCVQDEAPPRGRQLPLIVIIAILLISNYATINYPITVYSV